MWNPKMIHVILLIDIPLSLAPSFQIDLQNTIRDYFEDRKDILYMVNGKGTHIHLLVKRMNGDTPLSELLQNFKVKMQERMNDKNLFRVDLRWKPKHFAFAVETSEISRTLSIVKNQRTVHAKQSFEEEFVDIVNNSDIIIDGIE